MFMENILLQNWYCMRELETGSEGEIFKLVLHDRNIKYCDFIKQISVVI